ncbi:MarR family winged helix-turn-helix transcriptional regulator [Polymorphum gilvum]|uniref:Putative transcription regulator protein n=1 Tax=Polymorphum gilvum (strain LMG 25793 / CGMCC 1.9160 / SL003B-26A1) TaxID=991905 RepID=F2J0C5_POLGS|nr:MarR family transcriptional regulator [Polymorphum gilvum]ADZ68659.1 Putative transcription regulator protein [Polymorphum gilvum SL003B-26A1]
MTASDPVSSIAMLIVDLSRLLRRRFEAALAEVDTGLTVAEARALNFIRRHPGRRQAVLAERLNIEPMTLVGYLDSLERAGLVSREVDSADRRAKIVALTPAAAPVLGRIDLAINRVHRELVGDLPPEQAERARDVLAAFKANLLAIDRDGDCE